MKLGNDTTIHQNLCWRRMTNNPQSELSRNPWRSLERCKFNDATKYYITWLLNNKHAYVWTHFVGNFFVTNNKHRQSQAYWRQRDLDALPPQLSTISWHSTRILVDRLDVWVIWVSKTLQLFGRCRIIPVQNFRIPKLWDAKKIPRLWNSKTLEFQNFRIPKR